MTIVEIYYQNFSFVPVAVSIDNHMELFHFLWILQSSSEVKKFVIAGYPQDNFGWKCFTKWEALRISRL